MWLATVVGRRSYKNTELLFREATHHATWTRPPLITTDGFEFYERAIPRLFHHGCVYCQVLQTWRNNHEAYLKIAENAPALRPGIPLSFRLKSIAVVGLELLDMHASGEVDSEKETVFARTIANAREPVVESEIVVVDAIEKLFQRVYVH